MIGVDIDSIASGWIRFCYADESSRYKDDLFWAYDDLDMLCSNDPDSAWSVIKKIVSIDSGDYILSNVAAGPLEDLLVRHGKEVIDRVELSSAGDNVIKKMLGCVWRNNIPDDVWGRIKNISGESW